MAGESDSADRDALDLNAKRVEFATLALCAIGLVMVYSASSPYTDKVRTGSVPDTFPTLMMQFLKLGLAFALFLCGRFISLEFIRRHAAKFFVGSLLLLCLVPFIGISLNGSRRWLAAGPFTFQPVEMVKLAIVALLASRLGALGRKIEEFPRLMGVVALALVPPLALLWKQPDFGSSVFLFGVCVVLVVIAGAKVRHCALGLLGGLAGLALTAALFMPHVRERFEKHSAPKPGDQVYEALLSLGSGGLAGGESGIGGGVGKLGYVPMIQSDFIFAAVGEETGFIGTSLVIALFVTLTYAGARIARLQRDPFRFLLGVGLIVEVAVQALINLVVVTALGPTKGIALPFISSGGSALMFSLFGIGLLVNIARTPQQVAVESKDSPRYAADDDSAGPEEGGRILPLRRPTPVRVAARKKVVAHG